MAQRRPDAPRGVLNRQAADGRFAHERFLPSSLLAPFIEHYWTVRWDLRGEPPHRVETLSHPSVHLLFELGEAQVAGVPTKKFSRILEGKDRVFGIKFRPAAFQPVLGEPLSRITDRVISLRSVFGAGSDAVKRAILAEEDPERCVEHSERFLLSKLPAMPETIARMRDLVERLARDPSLTRVEQVAELAGLELRQLQRKFKFAVGVSPKWVVQRYRLHEAAAQLSRPNAPNLAGLALQLGYFDQSHFIRDFKAVVGRSPGDYVAERSFPRAPRRRGR